MADRRNRTRYPGVVDGNLARKLDNQELERRLERSGQLDFDQQYRRRKESEASCWLASTTPLVPFSKTS